MKVKYYDSDNKTVVIDVGNSAVEVEDDVHNWLCIELLSTGPGFEIIGSDAITIGLTYRPSTIILKLE